MGCANLQSTFACIGRLRHRPVSPSGRRTSFAGPGAAEDLGLLTSPYAPFPPRRRVEVCPSPGPRRRRGACRPALSPAEPTESAPPHPSRPPRPAQDPSQRYPSPGPARRRGQGRRETCGSQGGPGGRSPGRLRCIPGPTSPAAESHLDGGRGRLRLLKAGPTHWDGGGGSGCGEVRAAPAAASQGASNLAVRVGRPRRSVAAADPRPRKLPRVEGRGSRSLRLGHRSRPSTSAT